MRGCFPNNSYDSLNFISYENSDVVVVTETWLTFSNETNLHFDGSSFSHYVQLNRGGENLYRYIKDNHHCSLTYSSASFRTMSVTKSNYRMKLNITLI